MAGGLTHLLVLIKWQVRNICEYKQKLYIKNEAANLLFFEVEQPLQGSGFCLRILKERVRTLSI